MDQVNIKIYKNVQKTYQIIPIDSNGKRIFGSETLLADQVSVSLVPSNGAPLVHIPAEIRQQGSTIQISFPAEFSQSVRWGSARYSVSISRNKAESTILSGSISVESIDGRMKNTMDVIQVVCDPAVLGIVAAYTPTNPTTTPSSGSNTGGSGETAAAPILEVGQVIAGQSPSVSIKNVNGKTVMDFVLPAGQGVSAEDLKKIEEAKQQIANTEKSVAEKIATAETLAQTAEQKALDASNAANTARNEADAASSAATSAEGKATEAAKEAEKSIKSAQDSAAAKEEAVAQAKAALAQKEAAAKEAEAAKQAKTEAVAAIEEFKKNPPTGSSLTTEQAAALNRFQSTVGTGATVDVENITDVPTLTVGTGVTRLRIRSYTGNSGLGGGEFVKVANTTAADLGMILKTKDGMTFQRDLSVDDFITPYMFGYTDGLTDATNFYQTVLTIGAKYKCRIRLPRNGTMPINKKIWSIPVGIKEIDGNNCTLLHTYAGNTETYLEDAIDGLHIHHLNIASGEGNLRCGGIFATGAQNIEISYCNFRTKQNHGILSRAKRKSGKSVFGWHIHHNDIEVDRGINYLDAAAYVSNNGAYQCILFDLDTVMDGVNTTNMDGIWKTYKMVPDAEGVRHQKAKIHDNKLKRSRYGIGVYYTENTEIYQNDIEDVVRGISMQDRARSNHVHHNHITNYTTGILNNYSCAKNVIEDNILLRTADWYFTGSGQAHIAAWVDPKFITVKNNRCEAQSPAGPSWGIAFGVNAEGNTAEGNTIVGKIGRSVFNTESSWAAAVDTTIGYGTNDPDWSTEDTKNNAFIGNHVDVSTPCVVMAVISNDDNGVTRKNIGTVFQKNIIKGSSAAAKTMFRVMEKSSGGVVGAVVEGNIYQDDVPASKFIMGSASNYANLLPEVGRPSTGFETSMGGGGSAPSDLQAQLTVLSNLIMGVSASIDLTGDGVLSIGASNNSYALRNLATGTANNTLKSITGGAFGREIIVQFQAGYQVQHSDVLRLTGAASITSGINGNTFIRFKCIDSTNQKWTQI